MERNYSKICTKNEAELYQDADNAITECNLWDWMAKFEPEEGKGFMFSKHPNIENIHKSMKLFGAHSGGTYGDTMRTMQYIAIHGWESFKQSKLVEKQEREKRRN